jgi:inhibitor of KinA sporulation pathway (predicted exonuclease)
MRYVIVDLEATCWEKGANLAHMEIIEIGAVLLPSSDGQPISEFACFVRPIVEPVLSDFCMRLTSIQQRDVDQAEYFYTVFPDFLAWIGAEEFTLCSWGNYDLNQFRTDCNRHGIRFPASFEQHLNLKKEFAAWKGVKRCGMKTALAILNLPLEGQHHRAIDDARNIARIARILLPNIEERE